MSTNPPNPIIDVRLGESGLSQGSEFLSLPARRPRAFWVPVVFVLVTGSTLSLRNYRENQAQRQPSRMVATTAPDQAAFIPGSTSIVGNSSNPSLAGMAASPLPGLLLSMAIVVIASVTAGFSVARFRDRRAVVFRTFDEARRRLPMPVLGVVPVYPSPMPQPKDSPAH
jgi:hypothetical protein